jgi:hypothetical protein
MNTNRFQLVIAAAAFLPGLTLAGPFQNGSFENGLNPPTNSYRSLYAGNTDIDGWVVVAGRIDWSGPSYFPKDGLLSAQLVGKGSGISQTFDTTIGQSYNVSFSLQPAVPVTTPATVDVTLGGSTYHAVIPVGPGGAWYDYSTILSASSNSSTLEFSSIDAGYVDPFLDDVRVTPGPSPTNSPPTIFAQPQSQTNAVGGTTIFTVAATGTAPLTYQWSSNSLPLADGGRITGVYSNQLTIAGSQVSDSASYSVMVSNAYGFAVSSNALLTVTTNLTWTGAVSSDWNNPGNWNPPLVPGASNRVVINSGSVTIPANATFAVMDWTGGSISGALTVASNGVLNIAGLNVPGSTDKTLYAQLTNYGTVVWTGGQVLGYGSGGAAVYNQPGALWDAQCDLGIYYGDVVFANRGIFRKSVGSGTTIIGVAFNSTGTVDVQTGTVRFQAGGNVGGTFTTAVGAAINVTSGNFTEVGVPVFNGGGQSQMTGGSLTLTTDVIPGLLLTGGTLYLGPGFQGGSITNLTLNGATLSGNYTVSGTLNCGNGFSGSLLVADGATLNWSAGTISGALTVASNGVLNIAGLNVPGSTDKTLYAQLTNYGTVVWTGGQILGYGSSGAAIYNQPGALWDAQCDLGIYYGDVVFANQGILRKSVGTGTTIIGVAFNNTGTVEVQTGTMRFNINGSLTGSYFAATGAAVEFNQGTFTLVSGPPASSGAGQVRFTSSSSVQFSGPITNFDLGPGTLVGTNVVTGVLNWTGGWVYGALTVASNGVLNVAGSTDKSLYAQLTNYGTVVWTGGQVLGHGSSGAAIYNQPGALWDAQCDLGIYYADVVFVNQGILRKSVGSGTTIIGVAFNNAGTVEAQTGMIRFNGAYSNAPSANLTISLGGAAPGSGYGQIQFTQPPTFAGTFSVSTRNGYRPNPGDTFQVLSYPSATNTFVCLSGLDLGGGILLQAQFSNTGLSLATTTYTPGGDPRLVFTRSPNGLRVQWPLGFDDWDLQFTTNLASPTWAPVPTQCNNQALVPTVLPQQHFRLAKRAQPLISDPVGNLTGDTNRTYMDIVAVTMRTENTNYVLDVQMAGAFPTAGDMAGGKRFDVIWFVDIDRNRATGQGTDGNDYNIHIFLDETGWHYYWLKVSSVSQTDGIVNLASAFTITVVGDRATLTFPRIYLPSNSFEMWAYCFSGNASSWTPYTQNPNTARAVFDF